jgi:hypothetical protein
LLQCEYEEHLEHGQGRRITLKAITGATSFGEFSRYMCDYATDHLPHLLFASVIAVDAFCRSASIVGTNRLESA